MEPSYGATRWRNAPDIAAVVLRRAVSSRVRTTSCRVVLRCRAVCRAGIMHYVTSPCVMPYHIILHTVTSHRAISHYMIAYCDYEHTVLCYVVRRSRC